MKSLLLGCPDSPSMVDGGADNLLPLSLLVVHVAATLRAENQTAAGCFAPGHHVMELGSESSSLSLSLSLSLSRWAGWRTYMGTIESFQKFTQQWPPALLARKMLIQAADPLALHQLCAGMTMLAGSRKRLLLLLTTGSAPPGTKALGCVCLSL